MSCSDVDANNGKQNILLGIDKITTEKYNLLKGKKVGLFTNFSGRTAKGILTAEVFAKQNVFTLKYLFSPEHGFFGGQHAGEKVDNQEIFGIPVISLYGSSRYPNIDILKELDVIVIDIQDIGIRSYTFLSSVNYMLAACAEAGIPAIVLDRPNPIGGNIVDGAVTQAGFESFMSLLPVPYIHGLTLGEISKMMNEEGWLKTKSGRIVKCNLTIIKMEGWRREMRWEDCGLLWFPTSPQIPTPDAIRGAAMLGIFGELGILNIGIGTSLPFQYIGMPGLKVDTIYKQLQDISDNGVLIQQAHFKPFYGRFAATNCQGFILRFPNSDIFKPYTSGVKIMLAIRKVHEELFELDKIDKSKKEMFIKVTGGEELFTRLFIGASDSDVLAAAQLGLPEFMMLRKKYLIYN